MINFGRTRGARPIISPGLLDKGQNQEIINRIFSFLGGPGPAPGGVRGVRVGSLPKNVERAILGHVIETIGQGGLTRRDLERFFNRQKPAGPSSTTARPVDPIERIGGFSLPDQVSTGVKESSFFDDFRSALTDRFTPTSAEQQLLENIAARTSAEFTRRGLGTGPIAATGVASSVAPSLVRLRQNRIRNLGDAITQSLGGQQLGLTQRQQDITAGLGERDQDITQRAQDFVDRTNTIQALLNFLRFGEKRTLGQRGGESFNFGILSPSGSSAGGSSGGSEGSGGA